LIGAWKDFFFSICFFLKIYHYHIYLAMFMWTPLWAFPSARGVPGLHW
jgi:hypothetical protein